MTVSLKHTFVSAIPDGPDANQIQPSNWNDEHVLTMATARLLGRTTAGDGAAEEISVGSGLSLTGGVLDTVEAQNLFRTIAVSGQSDVVADSTTDTLTLAAGTGVTITTDATTDTVTFAVTSGTYQPLDSDLTTLAGLSTADGNFIVGNGSAWTVESGSTARASLGLGTMATETATDYLTTAAAALAYQPLDADLTAWAAVNPSSYLTTAAAASTYQPLDADLTSWAGVTRASGFDTFTATPSSANLASLLTDETGSGAAVFGTAPAISDPDFTGLVDIQQTAALTGDISPSQITSNQNDYSPTGLSTASVLRLSTDASRDITGLAGGSDGRLLLLHNVGAQNIVLKDESASSTAGNRFALSADVTLAGDQSTLLQYDSTSSRWRVIGGVGSSGGGGAAVTVADTAPGSPADGDLWYDTDSGGFFVYFDDGTSSQWAEVGGLSAIADGSIANAKLADVATSTLKGRLTSGTGEVEDLTIGNGFYSSGTTLSAIGVKNVLINGCFRINQRAAATNADDTYAHDRWNILTQTGTVAASTQTLVEDGTANMMRITQSQASAQRFGFEQIIEAGNTYPLRGQTVTLSARVRMSASTTLRYAILEWTGTADSPVSDVVNDWTSGTFTAGNFFKSTSMTVTATGSTALTANTLTNISLTGTLGSSVTNAIVMFWTDSTQAQNVTLDIGNAQLELGSVATSFERRSLGFEMAMAYRYCIYYNDPGQAYAILQIARAINSTTAYALLPALSLRVSPTITFGNLLCNASVSAVSAYGITNVSLAVSITASGMTGGATYYFQQNNNTAGYLLADAEL